MSKVKPGSESPGRFGSTFVIKTGGVEQFWEFPDESGVWGMGNPRISGNRRTDWASLMVRAR